MTADTNKATSVFELLGSYFTDILYNHLYASSKANKVNRSSLTDEYQRQVAAYALGVKTDKPCYSTVVQSLHQYFSLNTKFTTLSFNDFVDLIVEMCIPREFFKDCLVTEKDELLCSIVCDLVSSLATYVTTPALLRRVIDGHTTEPRVTIRMIQDAAVAAMRTKREVLHNQFLARSSQARTQVPSAVVTTLKAALVKVVKEKAELAAKLARASKEIRALEASLHDQKKKLAKQNKLIGLLHHAQRSGRADAGSALLVPPRDSIAEPELPRPGPDPLSASDSGDDDDESGSDEEEEQEKRRPEKRAPPAKARAGRPAVTPAALKPPGGRPLAPAGAAPASTFFRPPVALASAAPAAKESAEATSVPPAALRPRPAPPAMIASLLDDAIDMDGGALPGDRSS